MIKEVTKKFISYGDEHNYLLSYVLFLTLVPIIAIEQQNKTYTPTNIYKCVIVTN